MKIVKKNVEYKVNEEMEKTRKKENDKMLKLKKKYLKEKRASTQSGNSALIVVYLYQQQPKEYLHLL